MGEVLQSLLRVSFICIVGMEKVTVTTLPALMTEGKHLFPDNFVTGTESVVIDVRVEETRQQG